MTCLSRFDGQLLNSPSRKAGEIIREYAEMISTACSDVTFITDRQCPLVIRGDMETSVRLPNYDQGYFIIYSRVSFVSSRPIPVGMRYNGYSFEIKPRHLAKMLREPGRKELLDLLKTETAIAMTVYNTIVPVRKHFVLTLRAT